LHHNDWKLRVFVIVLIVRSINLYDKIIFLRDRTLHVRDSSITIRFRGTLADKCRLSDFKELSRR